MKIDLKLIKHLENLSKIELTDGERNVVEDDLRQIIKLFSTLGELPSDEEADDGFVLPERLREDIAKIGEADNLIFENAPDFKDGFFTVPKALE